MEINIIIDGEFEGCPDSKWFRSVGERALKAQNISSNTEMGLVITNQTRVQELNRTYRGVDRPTDVLAFYMTPEEGQGVEPAPFVVPPDGFIHLGEVIISYPQAAIQAQEHRHPVAKELAILIVHGVLHLLGYDHERPEQKRKMSAKEQAVLNKILVDMEEKNDEQG